MSNELDDLKTVFPMTKTVMVKGTPVEVSAYKFKQILQAFGFLSEIVIELGYLPDVENPSMMAMLLFGALGKHPDEIIGLVKLATGKEDAFYDELSAEEGLDLVLAVWEVNKDFFSQKLRPKLELLNSQAQGKTPETPQNDKPENTETA
jgi:hypothetical protein